MNIGAFAAQIGQRVQAKIDDQQLDLSLLGPCDAPIHKLRGKFRFHLFLNSGDEELLRRVIREVTAEIRTPDDVQWIVDIDPLDML